MVRRRNPKRASVRRELTAGVWLAVAALAVTACGFLAIGLVDDRKHLDPVARLLLAAALCYAVVAVIPEFDITVFYFSFWPGATGLGGWTALLTVLCLVGLKTAVNMAEG